MRKLFAIVAIIAFAAMSAAASDLGLFSTSDCSSCNLTAVVGQPAIFYVNFVNDGSFPNIISFAEFRIAGMPPGWSATWFTNPAQSTTVGNPLGDGLNIAFPGQSSACVTLITVTVIPTTLVTGLALKVVRHANPSSPHFQCPWYWYDCGPCGGAICVAGGTLLVNSGDNCQVGVAQETWSKVKQLYE